jgi:hypothetical protein
MHIQSLHRTKVILYLVQNSSLFWPGKNLLNNFQILLNLRVFYFVCKSKPYPNLKI